MKKIAAYSIFRCAGQKSDGIHMIVGEQVIEIPSYLFYNNSSNTAYSANLKKVSFKNNSQCENIGAYAFAYCSSLEELEIGKNVQIINANAFIYCSSLTDVTVTDSVEIIEDYAFGYCTNLINITLGKNVSSLSNTAFYSCAKLKDIYYNAKSIEGEILAFSSKNLKTSIDEMSVRFGSEVKVIPDCLFENVSMLVSVEFDKNSTCRQIGENAFSGTSIDAIVIPDSVQYIFDYAFCNCSLLSSIELPNNLMVVDYFSFYGCSSLEYTTEGNSRYLGNPSNPYILLLSAEDSSKSECTISAKTKIIAPSAFGLSISRVYYEGSLVEWVNIVFTDYSSNPLRYAKELYIGENLISSLNFDFECEISNYSFYGYTGLQEVIIGADVQYIAPEAFGNCKNLSNVVICSNNIDYMVFSYCNTEIYTLYEDCYYWGNANNPYQILIKAKSTTLSNFKVHEDTEIIAGSAFRDNENITAINIPENIKIIEDMAFKDCTSLKNVYIGSNVERIGWGAFDGCVKLETI